ncbi:hybrid sensor histidine kinase/response regulator [Halorubrum cibi]|uniref:hybrid sensor histidine kinase/response regulator n=1 Tax=Halorubrum cibi TaxID=413815 RepID=UPI00163D7049|nr:PAS domain S-box protein [Halorubrum cibi]
MEDDPGVRKLTSELLHRQEDRFVVTKAADADEALSQLANAEVDCIVSDLEMPGRDGLELLDAVRDRGYEIPFILFTAKGSESVASDAISRGATDYLTKELNPKKITLLANRIENAVDQFRTSKQLEEHEQRLETLLQASHDIITVLDSEGIIQYASPAVERLLGYRADELVDEPFSKYVHPDDRQDVAAQFGGSARTDGTGGTHIEYRVKTADGEWHWVESTSESTWRDTVGGYVVNTRDITDRKATERRFESLVEQSKDAIAILEQDGTIQFLSQSIENITSYEPEDLEGDNAFDHVHPDDHEDVMAAFQQLIEEPDASPVVEYRFKRKDGSWRWTESTGTNALDDPAIEGIVINSREISREKRQKRKISRYETLLETLPLGVAVLDSEAHVEWVNEAFWTAIDKDEDEVMGVPFVEIIEEGLVSQDVADKYFDAVRHLLSSDNDDDRKVIDFQVDPPHVDGTCIYEGYVGLQELDEGEFTGTVNAFLDVTDRKERKHELEEYKDAMEAVPDGVFLLDENGTMTRVNEAWASIVGFEQEELSGVPFLKLVQEDIIDRDVVDAYLDLLPELLSSESPKEQAKFTTRVIPPNEDREHVYEIHISLLSYEDEFQGAAGVVRDITEKVHRQEQLERENDRLDEFTSIVGHDLRNPLNVASASFSLAEETGDAEHFEHGHEALNRMNELIETLLTLAKSGDTIDELASLSLRQLAQSSWQNVETAESTLLVEDDCIVEGDPARLKQLTENLFRNAIEHGRHDANVRVGALEDGGGFFVEDDGPGIPEGEREKVFQSGYSSADDGTGFGLSIVSEIVEAHDWSVSITGSAEGGARFEFDTNS